MKTLTLANASGKTLRASNSQALTLADSGYFPVDNGQTVTAPDGREISVASYMKIVREYPGGRAALPGDDFFDKQEAEEKYGGLGGALKGYAYGALHPLGGFAIDAGLTTPKALRQIELAQPGAVTAGEWTGLPLATLAAGALTAATGGAPIVAGGLATAGTLAEAAAPTVVRSLGRQVLGSAAENAAIGAGFGAGEAYSQARVDERDVTAEGLLEGAAGGAAGGAILGAAMPLVGKAYGAVKGKYLAAKDARAATLASEEAIGNAAVTPGMTPQEVRLAKARAVEANRATAGAKNLEAEVAAETTRANAVAERTKVEAGLRQKAKDIHADVVELVGKESAELTGIKAAGAKIKKVGSIEELELLATDAAEKLVAATESLAGVETSAQITADRVAASRLQASLGRSLDTQEASHVIANRKALEAHQKATKGLEDASGFEPESPQRVQAETAMSAATSTLADVKTQGKSLAEFRVLSNDMGKANADMTAHKAGLKQAGVTAKREGRQAAQVTALTQRIETAKSGRDAAKTALDNAKAKQTAELAISEKSAETAKAKAQVQATGKAFNAAQAELKAAEQKASSAKKKQAKANEIAAEAGFAATSAAAKSLGADVKAGHAIAREAPAAVAEQAAPSRAADMTRAERAVAKQKQFEDEAAVGVVSPYIAGAGLPKNTWGLVVELVKDVTTKGGDAKNLVNDLFSIAVSLKDTKGYSGLLHLVLNTIPEIVPNMTMQEQLHTREVLRLYGRKNRLGRWNKGSRLRTTLDRRLTEFIEADEPWKALNKSEKDALVKEAQAAAQNSLEFDIDRPLKPLDAIDSLEHYKGYIHEAVPATPGVQGAPTAATGIGPGLPANVLNAVEGAQVAGARAAHLSQRAGTATTKATLAQEVTEHAEKVVPDLKILATNIDNSRATITAAHGTMVVERDAMLGKLKTSTNAQQNERIQHDINTRDKHIEQMEITVTALTEQGKAIADAMEANSPANLLRAGTAGEGTTLATAAANATAAVNKNKAQALAEAIDVKHTAEDVVRDARVMTERINAEGKVASAKRGVKESNENLASAQATTKENDQFVDDINKHKKNLRGIRDALNVYVSKAQKITGPGKGGGLVPLDQEILFKNQMKAWSETAEGKANTAAIKYVAPHIPAEKINGLPFLEMALGSAATHAITGGALVPAAVGMFLGARGGRAARLAAAVGLNPLPFLWTADAILEGLVAGHGNLMSLKTGVRMIASRQESVMAPKEADEYVATILRDRETINRTLDTLRGLPHIDYRQIEPARAKMDEALNYLESKRPPKGVTTGAEAVAFARAVSIMKTPTLLAKFVKDGTVTRSDADVMKLVSPESYARVQEGIALLQEKAPTQAEILAAMFRVKGGRSKSGNRRSMNLSYSQSMFNTLADDPGTDGGIVAAGRPSSNSAFVENHKSE